LSGAALRISRELIRQKLAGQEQVARFKLRDSGTADEISRFKSEISNADNIASIRLIEAQAALAYWSAFRTLQINFPRNDLRRVPDHWRRFGARISPLTGSPRLATNPPNAILNFLYAVLESEARLAAAELGLDPGLGVLHVDAQARDSLACDLMEAARPQVDAYLLDWITRQPLKREWFFEQRNGNCRLMGSFAMRLAETAATWGRVVAPVAEWIAQALWASRKSADSERLLPTRLTQRRRSEGRGNSFVVRMPRGPREVKVCEVCGVEGVNDRYCKSCGVEVSRDTMAQVASMAQLNTRTARARARAPSDHAVAISWWSQSSLPAWLNGEYYAEKILPGLKALKIREIAHAIGVSKPYAMHIRAGRCRPHRRHWLALAKLAGVQPDDNLAG